MPAPSLTSDVLTFGLGAVASISASAVLAWRIERAGGRLGISEALLGLVAALAADGPEITSSVTALSSGQRAVGVGVVLGSNVFNLAALLGIGSLVAGRIALHRRVILLEGAVALSIVAVTLMLDTGVIEPPIALVLGLVAFVPYCVVIGIKAPTLARLPLPRTALVWLEGAVQEEDLELGPIPASGRRHTALDLCTIAATLAIVIFASIVMEHAGIALGERYKMPQVEVGGILLAAITSLPNLVTAVYLARKGRGAAVLSEAMNSNVLNVLVGLLVPGVVLGLGRAGSHSLGIAWWYGGLTLGALSLAFARRGITRVTGAVIVAVYVAFLVSLTVH